MWNQKFVMRFCRVDIVRNSFHQLVMCGIVDCELICRMSEELKNGSSNVSSIPVLGLAEVSRNFHAENPICGVPLVSSFLGYRWKSSVSSLGQSLPLERLDSLNKFPGNVKLL